MIDQECENSVAELEPIAIFGFNGQVPCGLKVHPQMKHLIFSLGSKISILNLENNHQEFLCDHTNTISTIDVSKSGRFIASGQKSHMGFRACVIIWDWETRKQRSRYELHKVCVASLCFTADEEFLISLGGQDDGAIVVWNVEKCAAICGASAVKEVTGHATFLCSMRLHADYFITAGEQNLRLWWIDKENKKLKVLDAMMGKLRRTYTSVKVSICDRFLFAGTMSGDVVKVQINFSSTQSLCEERAPVLIGCYARHNPKKSFGKDCENYANGVRDLIILNDGRQLVIGAGDGTVELVEERGLKCKEYPSPTYPNLKALKRKKVNGAVTSLQLLHDILFIGTDCCEIYTLNIQTFVLKLQITCNTSIVYDIAFPNNFSLVFATASYQSVRVWSLKKKQELLRIMVPNFSASAVVFSFDGKSIITAWNDGAIRAFTPLTGKLIYAIPNAHNKGCSALAISSCDTLLVSGGCEGQVRLWKLEPMRQHLVAVLKEHTAPVASLHFNCFNREVVSASSDGTCIIWDVCRLTRKNVLYANTQFTCAQYDPSGVQVLATGTDRRITYWEVFDASLVREIEGSAKGSINCVSINWSGEMFVSAGNDQIVKLWNYQTGIAEAVGFGHAAAIVTCKFSPCGKYILSGSADGAVFIWTVPEKYWPKPCANPLAVPTPSSSKKCSKFEKKPENISQLESVAVKKDVRVSECPPIATMKMHRSASANDVVKKCPQNDETKSNKTV